MFVSIRVVLSFMLCSLLDLPNTNLRGPYDGLCMEVFEIALLSVAPSRRAYNNYAA